jgi:GT2 family glycosyltransferase
MSIVDVSIIIVSRDARALTSRCVGSIDAAASRTSFETIVVDNASADGSADHVELVCPGCRVLRNSDDLGFAAAAHRGIEAARGEYLLFVSPDLVPSPGSIDRLVQFARVRPEFGVYGGRTVDSDGALDPGSCAALPSMWSLFCFATGLSGLARGNRLFDPESLGSWQRDTTRVVGMVADQLLLVSREVYLSLGGFDQKYVSVGAAADLSARAWKDGYRPVIVPSAEAVRPAMESLPVTSAVDLGVIEKSGVIENSGGAENSAPGGSAEKVMSLSSRASYIRDHLRFRKTGLALLWLGVALRATVATVFLRSGARTHWRATWRQRDRWRNGQPTPVAPDALPAAAAA